MYIPKAFDVSDEQVLLNFIKQNSFGILFSQTEQGPFASHLPFLHDPSMDEHGYLIGHMAKANSHWKDANNNEVLVVFSGPHAYISPIWYGEPNVVPTWNYVTVHVYGKLMLVEEEGELRKIIEDSLEFYEVSMPNPWQVNFTDTFTKHLLQAIVGFKIKISKIEGKWKLSQNHSVTKQQRVITSLYQVDEYNSKEIAALMEANVEKVQQKGDV